MGDDNNYKVSYDSQGMVDGITIATDDTWETDGTFTVSLNNDEYDAHPHISPSYTITGDYIPSSLGAWPTEYEIEEMIKVYPALKIQYQKFTEVYNLVKDDYRNRGDDEIPF